MKAARITALVLLFALLTTGCAAKEAAAPQEKYQKQVFAMDTVMILTFYGETAEEAETALAAAEARLLALEKDLDPEIENSSVWAVNHNLGHWTKVSADCLAIAQAAQTVTQQSGNTLEPRLYPLIQAWGFTSGHYRVPAQGELDGYLAEVSGNILEIDPLNSSLRLSGGALAYGAVAKGYAAEKALEEMAALGAKYAIVSLGGNVQTLGEVKPDGSQWQVAITDPQDTGDYLGLLHVGQKAIVTSGGYQRYFVEDGQTYIHILDPATGLPVDNGLTSITIVCDSGVMADALSTALFVKGEEGALEYYRQYGGFELVLVTEDGRVVVTPGLRDSFEENSDMYRFEYLEN